MTLEEFKFVLDRCQPQPHDRFHVTADDARPISYMAREFLRRQIQTAAAERNIPVTCRAAREGVNVKVKAVGKL